MNSQVLDEVVRLTKELMEAPSCSSEAKQAAQQWLDSLGTDAQKEQTKLFLAELEEDIVTSDGLIDFAQSEHGISLFGAEAAKNMEAHAREIKKAGAKYCDCPACAAAEKILGPRDELLK